MVRGVGDGNIILMDELGNKMNADGARLFSSLQVIPVGYCREYKMNNAFLVKAENTWTLIKFCISQVFYEYTWIQRL
jgi:hypothetical protein